MKLEQKSTRPDAGGEVNARRSATTGHIRESRWELRVSVQRIECSSYRSVGQDDAHADCPRHPPIALSLSGIVELASAGPRDSTQGDGRGEQEECHEPRIRSQPAIDPVARGGEPRRAHPAQDPLTTSSLLVLVLVPQFVTKIRKYEIAMNATLGYRGIVASS
jgi:hypothetical protein